jgi:hypothetical protein
MSVVGMISDLTNFGSEAHFLGIDDFAEKYEV